MSETIKQRQATKAEIDAFILGTNIIAQYYAGGDIFDKHTIVENALHSFEYISLAVLEGELMPPPLDGIRRLPQEDFQNRIESYAHVINIFFDSLESSVNALPPEFADGGAEIYKIIRTTILNKE